MYIHGLGKSDIGFNNCCSSVNDCYDMGLSESLLVWLSTPHTSALWW